MMELIPHRRRRHRAAGRGAGRAASFGDGGGGYPGGGGRYAVVDMQPIVEEDGGRESGADCACAFCCLLPK